MEPPGKPNQNHSEMLFHIYYGDYHQNVRYLQVLARTWRNWKTHTLFVGM